MRRLILFDIDGTILSTNGAAKRAFHRALQEVHGTPGPIDTHDFAGKTDPQIARELLRAAGLDDATIDGRADTLWTTYLRELDEELAKPDCRTTVMDGVADLLDTLEDEADRVLVGLLTGNIVGGAERKLGSVDLWDRFRFGAFGSDSERRDGLPPIAVERAKRITGRAYRGGEIVVVGDTPHDVTCGRALDVRTVAVTTGRYDAPALHDAGADLVVDDLRATDRLLSAMLEG